MHSQVSLSADNDAKALVTRARGSELTSVGVHGARAAQVNSHMNAQELCALVLTGYAQALERTFDRGGDDYEYRAWLLR
jgi:hypothetical protein